MRTTASLLVVLSLLLAEDAMADVRLPAFFSDHMVLQAEMLVPVWGWAEPGEQVTVEFAGQRKIITADTNGNWLVKLDPLPASGTPRDLHVSLSAVASAKAERLTLHDVLVGEAWLASGQSNMHLNFAQGIADREKALAEADDPWVRQFTVIRNDAIQSPRELAGVWRAANRANLTASRTDGDSAVAYFFSRELRRELKRPVGVLHASVGATPIQAWSPGGRSFKTMIEPLAPYGLRGALWYQGESNLERSQSDVYADLLTKHVAAWRSLWGQGEFPFFYVQIAPFRYSQKRVGPLKDKPVGPLELPLFWEAQTAALSPIANSGMAVIHDSITDLDNVHPSNKRVPGERLALLALAKTYGRKELVCSGPVYKEMQVEGDRIRVRFDSVGSGLTTRDGQPPTFLEIAGADQKFVPADGVIEGDCVLVRSAAVPKPVAVRLGWIEVARPNLMNKEGLPAGPFRTDKW